MSDDENLPEFTGLYLLVLWVSSPLGVLPCSTGYCVASAEYIRMEIPSSFIPNFSAIFLLVFAKYNAENWFSNNY